MRHIAPGGRIDRRHADFGGPGQMAGSVRGTDENAMTQIDDWEVFRTYTDQGSADLMCDRLLLENVPARVEAHSLENAREAEYWVFVHRSLAHRARWIVAQLPPSDQELEFTATGKLSGANET